VDPLDVHTLVHGSGVEMPDPIEFVLSDAFLGRSILYPRQATMLKVIFLRDDLLTDYDLDVLGEWGETFARTREEGCQPDVLERIRVCKEEGRPWFREVVNVIGRRGGKGHLGAICGSYVLWHYLNRPGGPQHYYGMDPDKRLTMLVFAGKKEQATANQWRDLSNLIVSSACFAPYISRPQGQSLTLFAPTDILRAERLAMRGVHTEADLASFEVLPKESTLMAARGPASFCQFYDEMAHVVATGANRSAEEVYESAIPALDQFGVDGFIYEGSSPWQMTGKFYENWQRSIELEPDGSPAYPDVVMFQLASWGPYEDWRRADQIPLRRPTTTVIEVDVELPWGGVERREVEVEEPSVTHPPLHRAVQEFDAQMERLERANPDTFKVERRSRWATVMDAYLDQDRVAEVFKPWRGVELHPTERGRLSVRYKAHGDPAQVNDRFGWAVAHVEVDEREEVGPDGELRVVRRDHVVFDALDKWEAGDWADRRIHYSVDDTRGDPANGHTVEADIWDYIERFNPDEVTFDAWNSAGTVERLASRARRAGLPKRTDVLVRTTTAPLDWARWECLKFAINMGLVHAPCRDADGEYLDAAEIAELELRYLQCPRPGRVDHPTSGPVQSKDVGDCISEVVHYLIGSQITALREELSNLGVRGVGPVGLGGERVVATGVPDPRDPATALADLTGGHPARGGAPMPTARGQGRGRSGGRRGWGSR
jgi:hypothetical protein